LTFVVRDGVVEHVFYPVLPPGEHAREVLAWLRGVPPEEPTPATP
jgi:peroxiredoxin